MGERLRTLLAMVLVIVSLCASRECLSTRLFATRSIPKDLQAQVPTWRLFREDGTFAKVTRLEPCSALTLPAFPSFPSNLGKGDWRFIYIVNTRRRKDHLL